MPKIDEFWTLVDKNGPIPANRPDLGPCWPWLDRKVLGYGYLAYKGKQTNAVVVAYELLIGPFPEGLVPDHLCLNRACANPHHVEPVTRGENVRRGIESRMTPHRASGVCPFGHDGYHQIANGMWYCKECHRLREEAKRRALGVAPLATPRVCSSCGNAFVRRAHNQHRCSDCRIQRARKGSS